MTVAKKLTKIDAGAPGTALEQLGSVDHAAYCELMGIEPDHGHLGIRSMRRRVTGVTVEYSEEHSPAPGFPPEPVRVTKTFPKDGQARKFYREMLAEGRNPKIVSASLNDQPMEK